MGKVYAVAKGKFGPQIYDNWSDCKDAVSGFSNAVYKGVRNVDEAKKFIEDMNSYDVVDFDLTKGVVFYVDGSYEETINKYAYAVLVLREGKIVWELRGSGSNPTFLPQRNVSGEILGVLKALQYASDNDIDSFSITYDYTGIKDWATGYWLADTEISKSYQKIIQECLKIMDIKFIKVESHTGEFYNDRVDYLAKKALGLVQ